MNTEPKKKEKKNNRFLRGFVKFFIILIAVSAACAGVFYFSYSYVMGKSDNSYEKDIKAHISKINNLNTDIGKMANLSIFNKSNEKNQDADLQKAITNLSGILKKISDEQDAIKNITAPSKYTELQSNLVKGINSNYLLYKEILFVLQNKNSSTIDTNEKNINTYKDDCLSSYAFVSNVKNFNISLPDTSLSFVYNFISYTDALAKVNKVKAQNSSIMTSYITSVDALVNKFIAIRKNYAQDLPAIRNSNTKNYDDLILSLDRNIGVVNDILNSLSSVAVPPDAAAVNSSFKTTLGDYSDYLANFENAVLSERDQKSSAALAASSNLTSLYGDSDKMYNKANQDYDYFNKIYSDLKSSNSNSN